MGQIVLLVYAGLMLVGGVVGYATARSRPSVFSGAVAAAALVGAWFWSRTSPAAGYGLGAVIALALCLAFSARFSKTGKFMPSGMLLLVSLAALAALGWAAFKA